MYEDPLALAAWIAFVCGRRICDILRISIADIFLKATTPLEGLAALLVDHKTAQSQGCFALHLPNELETVLRKTIDQATRAGSTMLFGSTDWKKMEAIIKTKYLPQTDLRGLRRGGLCQASIIATSDDDLLVLSDHTSTKALKTYLGGGLLSAIRRRKQITFVENTMERINSATRDA